MTTSSADLAHEFAHDIASIFTATVANTANVRAETTNRYELVTNIAESGVAIPVPLKVNGQHRIDLSFRYLCTISERTEQLAVDASQFKLSSSIMRTPIIRFDYQRNRRWAPAHVQVHAESSAVGHLRAQTGKAPEPWRLHVPVGGPRFRPTLEDVIEFAINEFGVDAKTDWQEQLERSRIRWRLRQTHAAIRDAIGSARNTSTEFQATIQATLQARDY